MADILDTMTQAGSLKTFSNAINVVGLADKLRAPGPYTVFAPADEAFIKLPAGTLESILNDILRATAIVSNHVVATKLTASDLAQLDSIATMNGETITVDHNGNMTVSGAKIVQAEIECDNGILYVIDTVIIPK